MTNATIALEIAARALGLPAVHVADLNELLPLALACFLLGAVESAGIGRMFLSKHGGRSDANQELLALATANLAAGLGRFLRGGFSLRLLRLGQDGGQVDIAGV